MGCKEIALTIERRDLQALIKGESIFSDAQSDYFSRFDDYPGIRVIEHREHDTSYDCAQYVFKTVLKEDWCFDNRQIPLLIGTNVINFLKANKFIIVDEPKNKDVVVYGNLNGDLFDENTFEVKHFGIYQNCLVTSKFGGGSVIEHPIDLVPLVYGTHFLFMRKQSNL